MTTPPPLPASPTLPASPDWSNDKVIKFLELYEIERVIWDPCNSNHKLKHKVHDAWNRISNNMDNIPIEELKLKKKSLMATFRPLLKKKKTSIRSGAGVDDVFQPIWFAFEIMERFLGTLYDVQETINTARNVNDEDAQIESQQDVEMPTTPQPVNLTSQPVTLPPEPDNLSSQSVTLQPEPVTLPLSQNTRPNKGRKKENLEEAHIKISQTLDTLHQVLKQKRNQDKDEDECDIYAKLLAKKLRKYPESMRPAIMYQIDGILLHNPVDLPPYYQHQSSTPFPLHVIPQAQQSERVYLMQPSGSQSSEESSIMERNVEPQNQRNLIERAYFHASQM